MLSKLRQSLRADSTQRKYALEESINSFTKRHSLTSFNNNKDGSPTKYEYINTPSLVRIDNIEKKENNILYEVLKAAARELDEILSSSKPNNNKYINIVKSQKGKLSEEQLNEMLFTITSEIDKNPSILEKNSAICTLAFLQKFSITDSNNNVKTIAKEFLSGISKKIIAKDNRPTTHDIAITAFFSVFVIGLGLASNLVEDSIKGNLTKEVENNLIKVFDEDLNKKNYFVTTHKLDLS